MLGKTEGSSCSSRIGLIPIYFIMWINNDKTGLDHPFQGLLEQAKKAAYVDAVRAARDADALIVPIVEQKTFMVPPWYFEVCVTISGKAIIIKDDDQLSAYIN